MKEESRKGAKGKVYIEIVYHTFSVIVWKKRKRVRVGIE
jgi:hypothetical protein